MLAKMICANATKVTQNINAIGMRTIRLSRPTLFRPYTDSQQGEGSQQLVSSTEDRPDGEVGAKGHITGQYNGNQSSNKRVCENIALSFAGFRINLSEQLLENEAAQTGCGIQSSHSESGYGQSNEAFSYAEGEAELGHEGTNAISEYVYRTTVFQSSVSLSPPT